nr:glycosyl hydrolase [Pseudomonadota bacterium]
MHNKLSLAIPLRALLMVGLGLITASALARPAGHAPSTAAERDAAWQQHESMRAESLFSGLHWRSVGPTKQSGRVVAIAGVPGQPYTFYVAYATGGVWKTSDNGAHFMPLSDRMPTLVTGAIAVDPRHPDTLWVGTGEANSSRSSYGGKGLYRSDDGGKSFQFAGLPDSDRIARIVIDPKDSNTVYVAAIGKLYTTGGQRGVFRTRDRGKTWQQVLKGATPWTGAIDLTIDPRNPDVLYAALWDRSRTAWNMVYSGKGSGIWKSIDAGDHWMQLTDGFPHGDKIGRIGLAIAPSQPDTLYVSIDDWTPLPANQRDAGDGPLSPARLKTMGKDEFLRQDPQQIERFILESDLDTDLTAAKLIGMIKDGTVTMDQLRKQLSDANADLFNTDIEGLMVYRSDDDGAHWHKTNEKPLRDVYYTYGYYFGQIRVAPNDPDHVYAEGLPLIESKDGGKAWSGLNDESVHGDYHELLIDPADPQRMLVGNDGGANITYDGGAHWQKFGNLPVGQFYSVTYDMADPYNVYGGLQDNGAMMGSSHTDWERADNWKDVGGGDGMYVQVDPRDNKTIYAGFQF